MQLAALRRRVLKLQAELLLRTAPDHPILGEIRRDAATVLTAAKLRPDHFQTALLRSSSNRILILASRQVGKSLTAGALALREALWYPRSLILLLSRSQRQSSELFRDKVLMLFSALGRPLAAERESALTLELTNGSRIVSLPATEATVRVYAAVRMLVIDEAARVPDELYRAVRPMLAVSQGRLVCLSSAYAQQGFFYEAWTDGGRAWTRVQVRASECKRIPASFLAEERRVLGQRIYEREYEGVFCQADDAVFDVDSIRAALTTGGPPPLF
jgi:hypothetical protein